MNILVIHNTDNKSNDNEASLITLNKMCICTLVSSAKQLTVKPMHSNEVVRESYIYDVMKSCRLFLSKLLYGEKKNTFSGNFYFSTKKYSCK